jgi:hypothetical protein
MLRNVMLLCAALVLNGAGALAEEDAPAKTFRYAIFIDEHEPISGEVNCSKYPCQLVDHQAPDIDLSLGRYDDTSVRPIVYCRTENCFISYRSENIDLSQSGKILRFDLAEGDEPGHHAVLLESRKLGEIIIAF